ncbi:TrkH family potassium uptake protein [Marinoscillum furvescens]|uniref:Trk system potassium uptake protein TrkH n=1 Tax=Marinoscillum furvescens DSM 4134 TaxID=1122208 RepID=A0A3D9KW32_MARFU|nr:potassium transporter TrkG [Marinoscillum furvescens]RED92050.1 trk system potassium uptake protein TrkH [Marinoscillum furvescens DSM 4134]
MEAITHLFKGRPRISRWLSYHLLSSPPRMILLSFLLAIGIGTVLLCLPAATAAPGSMRTIDALFMATSATCVTGLSVMDPAADLSLFGQLTLLALIQLGGLGIMSFSTFFMFLFVGKLTISGRGLLVDSFSQNPIGELGKLIVTVFSFTFVLEIIGAAILTYRFLEHFSWDQAVYYGIFQSISAFCNAGFDILPGTYAGYAADGWFVLTNILLIIAGGLGFIVIFDINAQAKHLGNHFFSRLSLHSKITISLTVVLLLVGAVFFVALEYTRGLSGMPWGDQVLTVLFQSATTRTAGFTLLPISELSAPTLFVFMLLMFIGASPGSCGGGIKTTTFMLFLQGMTRQFSENQDINLFYRRIPGKTLSKAASIVFFAIFTIATFMFLLLLTEVYLHQQPFTFMEVLFETVSAFGTVGLSLGITGDLSPAGKVIVSVLMYLGRLGPITLVLALKTQKQFHLRYLKEDILVG